MPYSLDSGQKHPASKAIEKSTSHPAKKGEQNEPDRGGQLRWDKEGDWDKGGGVDGVGCRV